MQPVSPHCDSVIQQSGHFSRSFSSLFRMGDQRWKTSLEEGLLAGTSTSWSLSSARSSSFWTRFWLIPPAAHCGLCGLLFSLSFFFFLQVIDPLVSVAFFLFWLQSDILYLKPLKRHPLIFVVCWIQGLLDKLECGILASLTKSSQTMLIAASKWLLHICLRHYSRAALSDTVPTSHMWLFKTKSLRLNETWNSVSLAAFQVPQRSRGARVYHSGHIDTHFPYCRAFHWMAWSRRHSSSFGRGKWPRLWPQIIQCETLQSCNS